MRPARWVGLVLAAGEGRRLGGPKALVPGPDGGTWLARSVAALTDGGADDVYVVVGASADAVRRAAPAGCRVVEAGGWQEGMGASLRAGLAAVAADLVAERAAADAVVVMLVDTPGVGADVVRRLTGATGATGATGPTGPTGPAVLARAAYDGEPGHPVLIGRDHWNGVLASVGGDRGARDYLSTHDVMLVECADIGSGADVDTSDLLDDWRRRT